MNLPIYLDNNATTPCDPRVVDEMLPYFTDTFGNAASHHHPYGWLAEEAVDHAREQVARLIGASPEEIIFTSGATEADNLAIKGVFESYSDEGNHIITVQTEHRAVLDTGKAIEKKGGKVTRLSVDKEGLIDLDKLEKAITPQTILIAIMYANNETGIIQPVKEIGRIAAKHDVLFFSDGVQAAGKIPVNVRQDGINLMSLSAHKMYGPKGIGALYVSYKNPGVSLARQIEGGGHEHGMRSGTLNVPGIVGLGKGAALAASEMEQFGKTVGALRDRLEQGLLEIEHTSLNGAPGNRLPHVTNISFGDIDGTDLLRRVNKKVAVSSGSACSSASLDPSHVLKAMGVPDDRGRSSIRFSLGRFTTEEQINQTIDHVREVVHYLREKTGARRF